MLKYTEIKNKKLELYDINNVPLINLYEDTDGEYIREILDEELKIFQESNTIDQIKGVIKRETTWFNKTKNENTKLFEYELLREGIEYAEEVVKL